MARPTYTPTPEEREQVRRWIEFHSAYRMNGTPRPGIDGLKKKVRYPQGITTFADRAGLSRRAVRQVLNGDGPCTVRTWNCILAEMEQDEDDHIEELAASIGSLTGTPRDAWAAILEKLVDKSAPRMVV